MTAPNDAGTWTRWSIGVAVPAVILYMGWTTSTLLTIQASTTASNALRDTAASDFRNELGRLRDQVESLRDLLHDRYYKSDAIARARVVDHKIESIEVRLRELEQAR